MKPILTTGIILTRVNYQEADRILTILTNDQGKVRVMAKGVRKIKSKLAGGVELFSVSELSVLRGRGEVGTLVSSRLLRHYETIVKDIDRTMYAYEFLKVMNKVTEDNAEQEYFQLTNDVLAALNVATHPLSLVKLWADMQLLGITGHQPNTMQDSNGALLQSDASYDFDSGNLSFEQRPDGIYSAAHIKVLRLAVSQPIDKVALVSGIEPYVEGCQHFAQAMRRSVLHV